MKIEQFAYGSVLRDGSVAVFNPGPNFWGNRFPKSDSGRILVLYAKTDLAGKTSLDSDRSRVEALVHQLMGSGIDVTYSFNTRRAPSTAEPIKKARDIKTDMLPRQPEATDVMRRLRTEHMDHRVLMVNGSSTFESELAKNYDVKNTCKLIGMAQNHDSHQVSFSGPL